MELKKDRYTTYSSIFSATLVISNVLSTKLMVIGPLIVPGGVICYAVTYLMTDVIGELYGKAAAGQVVRQGLLCQVICMALIQLTLLLPGADIVIDEAYDTALGMSIWFTIAGLVAYVISQRIDVEVFHLIRHRLIIKGKGYRWVWNNTSTLVSQAIDTIVFLGIAFGLGLKYLFDASTCVLLFRMMMSQYMVKAFLAILDTPFFYLMTRNRSNI